MRAKIKKESSDDECWEPKKKQTKKPSKTRIKKVSSDDDCWKPETKQINKSSRAKIQVELEREFDLPEFELSPQDIQLVRTGLLGWYAEFGRELPWRVPYQDGLSEEALNQRGYTVWVSEIMLQQTQVNTVMPYFRRWMEKWPTVKDLATATKDEVSLMWTGLGYYSRAHRLLQGAQLIVDEYGGNLPRTPEALEKLPGIGPYTSRAIASIAFNVNTIAIDGNLMRIITRLYAFCNNVDTSENGKKLWRLGQTLIDGCSESGDFNQALMDFGNSVCTPTAPKCNECPLSAACKAFRLAQGLEVLGDDVKIPLIDQFPFKTPKKKPRVENRKLYFITKTIGEELHFLVFKRPDTGLLASLWEFPNHLDDQSIDDLCTSYHLKLESKVAPQRVGEYKHQFSHIKMFYACYVINNYVDLMPTSEGVWTRDIESLGLSTNFSNCYKLYLKIDDTKQTKLNQFFNTK